MFTYVRRYIYHVASVPGLPHCLWLIIKNKCNREGLGLRIGTDKCVSAYVYVYQHENYALQGSGTNLLAVIWTWNEVSSLTYIFSLQKLRCTLS